MIAIANKLLSKFGLQPNIREYHQCNDEFFVKIYEAMLNEGLPGLFKDAVEVEEKIHNVQVVVDSLATDILDVDLSHISAHGVVNGEEIQIQNLLEIFDGLLDFVMEEMEKEDHERSNDSNAFPDNHEILSDVFQEEFGHSFSCVNQSNQQVKNIEKSPKQAFHVDKLQSSKPPVLSWVSHTGDSTNELIKEAESVEDEGKKEGNYKNTLAPVLQKATSMIKEGAIEMKRKDSPDKNYSSILHQTSSAVDSLADINEIGKRPRRQLQVERKTEQKVQMHEHTHHHFHHHNTDTFPDSTTSSCQSSPSTSSNSFFHPSSLQKKKRHPSPDDNKPSIENHSKLTPHKKDKKFITTEIQTERPLKVDSSVQTEHRNKTNRKLKSKKEEKQSEVDGALPTHNQHYLPSPMEFLKSISSHGKPTQTRSKQLNEINERLSNLRPHVNREKNLKTINPETRQSERRRDEKSKVSFACDVISHLPSHSSDTEIDYSMKLTHRKTNESNLMRSPLKKRPKTSVTSSSSGSSDDTTCESVSPSLPNSINARFENPYVGRDERLRDLQDKFRAVGKENRKHINKIKRDYSKQKRFLAGEKKELQKQCNADVKTFKSKEKKVPRLTSTRIIDKSPEKEYAIKLARIYGKSDRGRERTSKCRKRSASSSPIGRGKFKSRMILSEDDILPAMEENFPFIYLSPHTAKLMWQKQIRHAERLCKATRTFRPNRTQQQLQDAQRRQEALTRIMKKELEHNKRLKEYKQQKDDAQRVKRTLAERRQRCARARRYYDDYVVKNRAKMLKKKYKEEMIFRHLFEEGLEIQKERLQEMKNYAKEQREKNEKQQRNQIESMENYYRGQFELLAESIAQERYELQVRQKAQKQAMRKMKCEMRQRMESDIKTIQQQLHDQEDSYSFRQIDADNLRKEFQLATYKASILK